MSAITMYDECVPFTEEYYRAILAWKIGALESLLRRLCR
jgi:hypothetical protein